VIAIAVCLGAWLVWTWLVADVIRQQRNLQTLVGTGIAAIVLLAWLVALSGLSKRFRLGVLAIAILALASAASLLRIRGVSGDLIPILAWRWESREPPPAAGAAGESGEAPRSRAEPLPIAGEVAAPPAGAHEAGASPPPPRRPRDFPQFLGPQRDGTVSGLRLARDWSTRPPRKLWRRPVGAGWSGFAIVGERAVTQEQHGAEERVVAYDLQTGRVLWTHTDAARYDTVIAGVGPRATPTIAEGRVLTLGATGILNALDLATGRRLWTRSAIEENGGAKPQWGKSCSPLVVGSRVIVSVGGPDGHSLVAYDVTTGTVAWGGGSDRSSYSSPFLTRLAGRPVVVILNDATMTGHDPETGALLFEHAWPSEQPSVAVPALLGGDRLLVSAGYGVGSKAYRIAARPDGTLEATIEWESPRLKSKFANVLVHRGLVYGLDDGVLTCLDPATGERRWKGGRFGHGQMLLVEDLLLVQSEEGEVLLLEPSPEGARERTRFPALEGKTWNPPALAGALLLVRNDREAAAYELPVE